MRLGGREVATWERSKADFLVVFLVCQGIFCLGLLGERREVEETWQGGEWEGEREREKDF